MEPAGRRIERRAGWHSRENRVGQRVAVWIVGGQRELERRVLVARLRRKRHHDRRLVDVGDGDRNRRRRAQVAVAGADDDAAVNAGLIVVRRPRQQAGCRIERSAERQVGRRIGQRIPVRVAGLDLKR